MVEVHEIGAIEAAAEVVAKVHSRSIAGRSALIFHQESGEVAGCILNTDVPLTFVPNHRLALGKTFSSPNLQNNEKLTSSTK